MGGGMSFSLSGKTALVTGSSRGIGAAIARGLAQAGAKVAVHCASRRAEAQAVADEIAGCVVVADLADPDAPQHVFDETVRQLGRVDILVSNASIQIRHPWNEITRAEFDQQVTVNWRASFELIQLVLPGMVERGWGRVLTVGSVQEIVPHREMLIYGATKAAQTHMVVNLAKQVAAAGVTVNNLAPGVIATDRNAEVLADPATVKRIEQRIAAGRVGEPGDCVGAALLLCSEAGRYITGQTLFVDGGFSL
jgi:glucose 1-dehydrogenase